MTTNVHLVRQLADLPSWEWPEEARNALLAVLGDRQAGPEERRLATELAGDVVVVDDTVANRLLGLLGDAGESDELRGQAAISLGPALELGDLHGFEDEDMTPISEAVFEAACEALRQAYSDARCPKDVRRRALEAAVRADRGWQAGAVRAAYASDDRDWRQTAVFCMGFLPGFEQHTLADLDDSDERVQREAVRAAALRGLSKAWRKIKALALSEASGKEARLAAIDAVAELRPHQAEEVLAGLLGHEDPEVAGAAREALIAAGAMDAEDED